MNNAHLANMQRRQEKDQMRQFNFELRKLNDELDKKNKVSL